MAHRRQTRSGRQPAAAADAAVGGSTREVILDAALAAFTEHTYGGTAMAQVAERAGVAVGSIYRHFRSKEALGNAVHRRWKTHLLEYLLREVDEDQPVRASFAGMWRGLRAFATEHPAAFAFLEHQQHAGYLDDESRAVSARVDDAAADLVRRGQRTGELRAGDPDLLVALAYGAFVGLSKNVRAGAEISDEQFSASEDAVWDLLRAPGCDRVA